MSQKLPEVNATWWSKVEWQEAVEVESQETLDVEKPAAVSTNMIQKRLAEARRAGARWAMRIAVPCLVAACILLAAGMLIQVSAPEVWKTNVGAPLAGLAAITMLMGLLPNQRRAIQVVIFVLGIGFVSLSITGVQYLRNLARLLQPEPKLMDAERGDPLWYHRSLQLTSALGVLYQACVGVWALSWLCRRLSSPSLLRNIWRLAFIVSVGRLVLETLGELVLDIAFGKMTTGKAFSTAFAIAWRSAIALAASQPNFCIVCQAWLARRRGKEDQAAGLAALIGGRSAEEVMDAAIRHFRCVPLDRVYNGDLAAPRPDPALHALTDSASFGQVDAFISHSWSDKPEDKWDAVQRWRRAFKAEHGREPKAWIDKYCIDQTHIAESLAGLPVFLSGCRQLVIFPGHTYTSRLWCMMELLTFITMGGDPWDVVAVQMGDHAVDWSRFDVRCATCTDPKDNAHLLQVLEDFSGTASLFSKRIQALLASSTKFTPLEEADEVEGVAGDDNQQNAMPRRQFFL